MPPTVTDKKPAPPKTPKKPVVAEAAPREIVWPELVSIICADATRHPGANAAPIDWTKALEILGWEDEEQYAARVTAKAIADGMSEENVAKKVDCKLGEHYDFTDMNGKKVWCSNNSRNRPFDMDNALAKMQEVLNGRWKLNGEALVISKHGEVVSAQHRLIGYCFAVQVWRGSKKVMANQAEHWRTKWPTEPVLESFVSLGVEDDEETVRTIDNVHPQTYSDTRYRQGAYGKLAKSHRVRCTKMEDFAIKLLWDRTGAKADAYAPRRTHAEAQDFLARHPYLEQCVQHIFEEDADGFISSSSPVVDGKGTARGWSYITPGTAAGLMYLMSFSKTDGRRNVRGQIEKYWDADPAPHQGQLNGAYKKEARQFWTDLASGASSLKALADRVREYYTDGNGELVADASATVEERVGMICLAWRRYREGQPVRFSDLKLEYGPATGAGRRVLINRSVLVLGGIDLGWERDQVQPEATPEPKVGANAPPVPAGSANGDGEGEPEYVPSSVGYDQFPGNGEPADVVQEITPLSEEEMERRKLESRDASVAKKRGQKDRRDKTPEPDSDEVARRVLANRDKPKAEGVLPTTPASPTLADEIAAIRAEHPGVVLLFKTRSGDKINAWGDDAGPVSKAAKRVVVSKMGLLNTQFTATKLDEVVTTLVAGGNRVAVMEQVDGKNVVTPQGSTAPVPAYEPQPDPVVTASDVPVEAPVG